MTNKQRLAVLEEQEELIADESEQEQREEEARKAQRELERTQKAEAEELEKLENVIEVASDKVPSEANTESEAAVDPDSVRMTSEQLHELGEALSILSAKSSVLQEKTELKKLVEENREAALEVSSDQYYSSNLDVVSLHTFFSYQWTDMYRFS